MDTTGVVNLNVFKLQKVMANEEIVLMNADREILSL